MKSVLFFAAVALVGSSVVSTAYAQKTKREQIVASCVAKAQEQIKPSGNPNDPGYNHRYNVYASCMRQQGQRP